MPPLRGPSGTIRRLPISTARAQPGDTISLPSRSGEAHKIVPANTEQKELHRERPCPVVVARIPSSISLPSPEIVRAFCLVSRQVCNWT